MINDVFLLSVVTVCHVDVSYVLRKEKDRVFVVGSWHVYLFVSIIEWQISNPRTPGEKLMTIC